MFVCFFVKVLCFCSEVTQQVTKDDLKDLLVEDY